jgi:AraC-like DNA-binding protein
MPNSFPTFHVDFFVLFIFLGIAQGLLLAYFFLRQKDVANRYFGLALLVLSILVFDIWLGYSNLMFQVLWLVDFSEPGNFIFSPALYLAMRSYVGEKPRWSDRLHFIPALIYFLYAVIALYSLPLSYKYNSNIGAWHPELEKLPLDYSGIEWRFGPQKSLDEGLIVQGAIYIGLSAWALMLAFQRAQLSFWSNHLARLSWLRGIVLMSAFILLALTLTKIYYEDDRGDPLLASFISLAMYLIMGSQLRRSAFFAPPSEQVEKSRYQRSSLQEADKKEIIQRLEELLQAQKPYVQAGFSLQSLAKQLKIQPHHLTQALNENLRLSFFELAAQYRIAEAKRLLQDPATRHLTIEDIAERVGYLSKSAFNAAFKKQTGITPSAWRDQWLGE